MAYTMVQLSIHLAPSKSAGLVRPSIKSRFEVISLYHGRLAECIVIFLADSTCILEHCIMTYTMAQLSIHLAPPKSAGLVTYRWLGVTHIHTHTCTCRLIHTHGVYEHA